MTCNQDQTIPWSVSDCASIIVAGTDPQIQCANHQTWSQEGPGINKRKPCGYKGREATVSEINNIDVFHDPAQTLIPQTYGVFMQGARSYCAPPPGYDPDSHPHCLREHGVRMVPGSTVVEDLSAQTGCAAEADPSCVYHSQEQDGLRNGEFNHKDMADQIHQVAGGKMTYAESSLQIVQISQEVHDACVQEAVNMGLGFPDNEYHVQQCLFQKAKLPKDRFMDIDEVFQCPASTEINTKICGEEIFSGHISSKLKGCYDPRTVMCTPGEAEWHRSGHTDKLCYDIDADNIPPGLEEVGPHCVLPEQKPCFDPFQYYGGTNTATSDTPDCNEGNHYNLGLSCQTFTKRTMWLYADGTTGSCCGKDSYKGCGINDECHVGTICEDDEAGRYGAGTVLCYHSGRGRGTCVEDDLLNYWPTSENAFDQLVHTYPFLPRDDNKVEGWFRKGLDSQDMGLCSKFEQCRVQKNLNTWPLFTQCEGANPWYVDDDGKDVISGKKNKFYYCDEDPNAEECSINCKDPAAEAAFPTVCSRDALLCNAYFTKDMCELYGCTWNENTPETIFGRHKCTLKPFSAQYDNTRNASAVTKQLTFTDAAQLNLYTMLVATPPHKGKKQQFSMLWLLLIIPCSVIGLAVLHYLIKYALERRADGRRILEP